MIRIKIRKSILVWCACLALGAYFQIRYDLTPSQSVAAAQLWPTASKLRHGDLPALLMFIHPHCPCSRASLAELNLIADHCSGRAEIEIVFVKPAGCADDWEKTALWERAKQIKAAHVLVDREGVEAERFGATCSGTTLLYDSRGQLLFQGGITSSRGHEGENSGRTAVEAILDGTTANQLVTPTFGCELTNCCSASDGTDVQCNR